MNKDLKDIDIGIKKEVYSCTNCYRLNQKS